MAEHHCGDNCALAVLERDGLSKSEAYSVAMEFTCFPMDCTVAARQAKSIVRAKRAGRLQEYCRRWYRRMERDAARAERGGKA